MNKLDVLSCPGFYAETEDVAIQAVHCSVIFDIDYDLFAKIEVLTYPSQSHECMGVVTNDIHNGEYVVSGMLFTDCNGMWSGMLALYDDEQTTACQVIKMEVTVKNGIIQSLNVWQL